MQTKKVGGGARLHVTCNRLGWNTLHLENWCNQRPLRCNAPLSLCERGVTDLEKSSYTPLHPKNTRIPLWDRLVTGYTKTRLPPTGIMCFPGGARR